MTFIAGETGILSSILEPVSNIRTSLVQGSYPSASADQIDIITNFAVITNDVIKRVYCIKILLFVYYLIRSRVGDILKSLGSGVTHCYYSFYGHSWICYIKFTSMTIWSTFKVKKNAIKILKVMNIYFQLGLANI